MRDPLVVLLALLVDEMAPRYCPTLCLFRQRDGARCWEVAVVCGAQGKVAHELEVTD